MLIFKSLLKTPTDLGLNAWSFQQNVPNSMALEVKKK